MDAMEVLLLCVVGFSVLVFLIVESLDSLQEKSKPCPEKEQCGDVCQSGTGIGSFVLESAKESCHQEEEKSAGADGEAQKQVVSEDFKRADFQEVAEEKEEEETENPVSVIYQKSGFRGGFLDSSGNNEDDEEAKKQAISENFKRADFQEETEEEEENPVSVSCQKSGFSSGILDISGNNIDDIYGNKGIIEDDGEVEEEILDDWEGIERTELEKIFGEAMVCVSSKINADQIRDVNLQLYGLQRVALQGPCRRPQPLALKVSARAKWKAWKKLGNMSRETAMEKYVDILSKAVPGWKAQGGDTPPTIQDAATSEGYNFYSICS